VVFHVYDRLHLDRLPRRYTVEPGKQLQGTWDTRADQGRYDLWVLGPNGYHRHLTGDTDLARRAKVDPELQVVEQSAQRRLVLRLRNAGSQPCTFTLRANAYRDTSPQDYTVPAGTTLDVAYDARAERGWYDLSVSVGSAQWFERRIAGRIESGADSISDPAMATEGAGVAVDDGVGDDSAAAGTTATPV